jgi:hypothetical protein
MNLSGNGTLYTNPLQSHLNTTAVLCWSYLNTTELFNCQSVATYSMAWNVFTHLNTGIVGSNTTRHGCLSAFILCLCCPVQVTAMLRADHSSKESYRLRLRNWSEIKLLQLSLKSDPLISIAWSIQSNISMSQSWLNSLEESESSCNCSWTCVLSMHAHWKAPLG